MPVSTTMMTVGGTRFTNSSGSSCADAVVDHRNTRKAAAARAQGAAPRAGHSIHCADHCVTMLPVRVLIRMFVSDLPGVWTAALRARWFNSS